MTVENLTEQESQMLRMSAKGMSIVAISSELGLNPHTVRPILLRGLGRLNLSGGLVQSRAALRQIFGLPEFIPEYDLSENLMKVAKAVVRNVRRIDVTRGRAKSVGQSIYALQRYTKTDNYDDLRAALLKAELPKRSA